MEFRLIACCETTLQDMRNNALSLINVIEELSAAAFPVIIPKLTMVTLASRSAQEPNVSVCRHAEGRAFSRRP
jgi:hypothetical protein